MREIINAIDQFLALAGNLPVSDTPRMPPEDQRDLLIDMIYEEEGELMEASDSRSLIEWADALGDIAYLCLVGMRNAGIDPELLLLEICRSNNTKFRPGYYHRADGKLMKSPAYTPPDITRVIQKSKERRGKTMKDHIHLQIGQSVTIGGLTICYEALCGADVAFLTVENEEERRKRFDREYDRAINGRVDAEMKVHEKEQEINSLERQLRQYHELLKQANGGPETCDMGAAAQEIKFHYDAHDSRPPQERPEAWENGSEVKPCH